MHIISLNQYENYLKEYRFRKKMIIPRTPRGVNRFNTGKQYYNALRYGVPAAAAYGAGRYFKNWNPFKNGKSSLQSRSAPPRRVYKRSAKTMRKVKGLTKQVAQLNRIAKSDQGTLIYRKRITERATTSVNQSSHDFARGLNSITNLEAVLAQLRYYDPTAPTALVTASGTSGTYSKEFLFDLSYHKITIRNNYQVPAKVRLYVCKVKEDTSIAANTAFTNGLADVGNPGANSALVYLTDSPQFNELWSIDKSMGKLLRPGQECVMTYTTKKFNYNPSVADSHTSEYQKSFAGTYFILRIEGVLGHDTAADQAGTLQSGIDMQIDSTWKVLYPAGADITYIVVDDTSNSFTNGGVVSSMPVSDNIGYSQS